MTTTSSAQTLGSVDSLALDALLAEWGLAGSYARSHLRAHGLDQDSVRAAGCYRVADPGAPALDAALVTHDGIGWALWSAPAQASALGAALPDLGPTLLSGPRFLVE